MAKYKFKIPNWSRWGDGPFTSVSSRVGKTLAAAERGGEHVLFVFEGEVSGLVLLHDQDCCEDVRVEDVVGDLEDLVGTPILRAEESSEDAPQEYGSGTWTYYKLGTVKGDVDIRWLGTSNGYYSESVTAYRADVTKEEQ